MARMIKCPRCQSQIDVTNVVGGSTVPCADCGVMLRVPTGQTGVRPAVPEPAPEPAAAAKPRERTTALFRKMAGTRSPAERKGPPRGGGGERAVMRRSRSSGPVVAIVCIVLAVGLVGLLVAAMVAKGSKAEKDAEDREARKAERDKQRADQLAAKQKQEQEWQAEQEREAAERAKKAQVPKTGALSRNASGKYDVPATFESGVRKLLPKTAREFAVDANLKKEYEALASAGKVDEIVKDDSKWMPFVIDGLLSDDEKIALSTYKALHAICQNHKISSKEDRIENPIKLEHFNSAYVRAGEYEFWSDWWSRSQNQAAVRQWATGAEVTGEIPEMVKWDQLVKDLRGGGYDDPNHPGGRAVQRIKLMGKGAYPYLVKYIDHEDIMIGKAVVTVLNDLTKQTRPLPTETTKAAMKAEWESWIKKNN